MVRLGARGEGRGAMDLTGRTAIVTGGSGSIGSAVATRFVEAGAVVVVADRVAPHEATLASLGAGASRLSYCETDVTNEASVRELVAGTSRDHGGPHILLNVAGGFRYGPALDETAESDWDAMMQLNLKSAFLSIKAVLPAMKQQRYGRIVSVAARSGLKGDAMVAPYAVSKAGVILLTQSAAEEVKEYDITINAVMPSIVDTAPNREAMASADFSAWVQPRDLAEVMLFLASDEARAVSGAAIPVYNKA